MSTVTRPAAPPRSILPVRAGRPRRLSPPARKLALTVHVTTSVGWLGIVIAMLVLGVSAATAGDPALMRAGYGLMRLFGTRVFPAVALGALLSGIVLSLGTKWGLIRYRWVVVKLVLTVVVIVTGAQITGRLLQAASATAPVVPAGVAAGLIVGSALHLLLLIAATAISVYKPWGKTAAGRRR